MKPAKTMVSVIIPTHNRVHSMKRLLDKLGSQTFPLELMEVIVVANSCTDSTITMLQNYQAPYKIRSSESSGDGPAVPRNKGATLATGSLLIFIDDDVDPSEGFVEAHIRAHHNKENVVVIGYLPFATPIKADYFKIELKNWWEEKFQEMQIPGYRFSYTDLLSGNFSISADLFKKVNGFVTGLRCRDDYELGIRLIKLGADFIFSKEAWAFHQDEVTDLSRSLKRKREEGKTDVKLWHMHPDVVSLPLRYTRLSRSKFSILFFRNAMLLFMLLKVTDIIASSSRELMFVMERLRLRGRWRVFNTILHKYWYVRGLFEELRSNQNLAHLKGMSKGITTDEEVIEIDLKDGINKAEQLLDQLRPQSIKLRYGKQLVGNVPKWTGAEPLRGRHLSLILVTKLSESFIESFALDKMMSKEMATETMRED